MDKPKLTIEPFNPVIGAKVEGVDLAIWDYAPHIRDGYRVTVKGDRPV